MSCVNICDDVVDAPHRREKLEIQIERGRLNNGMEMEKELESTSSRRSSPMMFLQTAPKVANMCRQWGTQSDASSDNMMFGLSVIVLGDEIRFPSIRRRQVKGTKMKTSKVAQ